jgi:tetratricopeptide (TPR) repeat protein
MRCLLLAAALLAAAAPPAAAESSEEARAHYQKASTFYDVGEYRQALAEFKAAYLAKPDPVFLFNMAQCYRMLHEPVAAGSQYRAYLRRSPDAPNREAVENFIKAAEAEEAAQKASSVQPTGTLTPKEEPAPPAPVEAAPAPKEEPKAPPPAETEPPRKSRVPLIAAVVIAAVVVIGAAVGIGVAASSRSDAPIPMTSGGYVLLSFH